MTQNPRVRALLDAQDKLWCESERLSQEAAHERVQKISHAASTTNSHLIRRVAELEAEVRQLRRQLEKHQSLEHLVQCGCPGQRA